jgi:hypothetical protein
MTAKRRRSAETPEARRSRNLELAISTLGTIGQKPPAGFDRSRMPNREIAQNGQQALAMLRVALDLPEGVLGASLREIRAHATTAIRNSEILDGELSSGGIRFRYRLADQAFPILWKGRITLSFEEFLPLTITGAVPPDTIDMLRSKAMEVVERNRYRGMEKARDMRARFDALFEGRNVEPTHLLSVEAGVNTSHMDSMVSRYAAKHHAGDQAAEERRRMAIEDPRLLHLDRPLPPRRVLALLGPTNSGKTHEGLDILTRAESGAYLGPLRLMALENHEAIVARGMPCSLLTGEDEVIDAEARHVSATVEMFDQSRHWGAVLVDEIQMLADPDRGWAWSRAFLSASTDLLVVAGSPDAEPLIRRLAAMNGDEVEVRRFERRNALETLPEKARWEMLRRGDAVIAFTRDDVLGFKSMIESKGLKAAAIYGALGPEARREQARRFREGDVDVLVATDAIGMGLNLPIDRVLFTRLDKFDGKEVRGLTGSETRQVAGRAGRFSSTVPGRVGLLPGAGNPNRLTRLLEAPSSIDIEGPMPMQPGWAVVSRVITERGLELENALALVADALLGHPDASYVMSADVLEILSVVKGRGHSAQDRFRHLGMPLSFRSQANRTMLAGWVRRVNDGIPVPAPNLHGLKPKDVADTYELRRIEDAVQQAGAYMWLARRFPERYPHVEDARRTRAEGTEHITRILSQKVVGRPCTRCGDGLPPGHRHAICDDCHSDGRNDWW